MRKRFVFFYAVISIIIVSVAIYVAYFMDKAIKEDNKQKEEKHELNNITKYIKDNKIKDTIKLKLTNTGEVIDIKVSDYLKGVVPSEMPPDYSLEALKAQAIVARTYLYQKISSGSHGDADICDNPAHCQAYHSKEKLMSIWESRKHYDKPTREKYWKIVEDAVDSTENIVVTYNGQYIKAYFHACSGGKTENVANIWGKQKIAYLTSVESLGEENYANYKSKVILSVSKLQEKLNNNESVKCSIDENRGEIVEIINYTDTGRVDKVKIGGVIYTAEKLRTTLGLKSTNFTVNYSNHQVTFNVTGYGHGIGMSQVGANYYANQGLDHSQIISHYYNGAIVTYVNKEE